ncbi:MAG: hypothetical protein P4L40_24635 [Terracidiphilus sp.]|nr:hypothetical protein [Terracidiphilus sp.]
MVLFGVPQAPESGWQYVPLITCARADLCLRAETVALLARGGLDPEELCYISDVNVPALALAGDPACVRITLMDHNAASAEWAPLSARVSAIVDHHHDTGAHPVRVWEAHDCCTLL